jgi:hypothetical protein
MRDIPSSLLIHPIIAFVFVERNCWPMQTKNNKKTGHQTIRQYEFELNEDWDGNGTKLERINVERKLAVKFWRDICGQNNVGKWVE